MQNQNFLYNEPNKKKKASSLPVLMIVLRTIPYLILSVLILTLIGAAIIGLTLVPHYATIKSAYANGMEAKEHFELVETLIKNKEFNLAIDELERARIKFVNTRESLEILEESFLFKNGYLRDQLLVAKDIVSIGEDATVALRDISTIGVEVYDVLGTSDISFSSLELSKKQELLALISNSTEKFEGLQLAMESVDDKVLQINQRNPIFIYDQILEPLQEQLPKLKRTIDSSMIGVRLLPALAGYPEEQTYLILLQNNREMRPSGGFIGAYGIIKVENAEIKELFIDNSYNLDKLVKDTLKIEAPEPIQKYMAQEYWFLRDANWWPDFPMSAQKSMEFYELEGGLEELDGVIALTPSLIEALVKETGTISVANIIFDYHDLWEKLEYEVEYGYKNRGIEEEERKDIIGELSTVLIKKLFQYPLEQWPDLLSVIDEQLDEKQLLFYFNDNKFQEVARENDWAGEVRDFSGDYVQLVDANLAALKTDSVMERTMNYNLSQVDDDLITKTSVIYQNTGGFSWSTTRYRTYTRLYVPEGSELISVFAGDKKVEEVDTYNEFGKTAFGVFFEVEPKTNKEVVWTYKLPERLVTQISDDGYKLLIQKQAGIEKMNLQLDFSFEDDIFGQDSGIMKYFDIIKTDQLYNIWFN
jgi:hypothetical protein